MRPGRASRIRPRLPTRGRSRARAERIRCSGHTMPVAPIDTADRITAPKFCGSCTSSRATSSAPPSTGKSSSERIASSGANATAPWWRTPRAIRSSSARATRSTRTRWSPANLATASSCGDTARPFASTSTRSSLEPWARIASRTGWRPHTSRFTPAARAGLVFPVECPGSKGKLARRGGREPRDGLAFHPTGRARSRPRARPASSSGLHTPLLRPRAPEKPRNSLAIGRGL